MASVLHPRQVLILSNNQLVEPVQVFQRELGVDPGAARGPTDVPQPL
jgi:hypothetical protein